MSIFKTAYDTTVTKGYNVEDIQHHVVESVITGRALKLRPGIYAITSGNKVPNFTQPIQIFENNKPLGIAIDVRQLVKSNILPDESIEDIIRNRGEFNLLLNRAILTKNWIDEGPRPMGMVHPKLMQIYSNWITNVVGTRFALDYRDLEVLKAISALYWLSLFVDDKDYDYSFVNMAIVKINQIIKIPTQFLKETMMDIDTSKGLRSIYQFVDLVKTVSGNVRLDAFSAPVLVSMISKTWFGNHHSEILAVALEHPPTFVALVYSAINETMFKRVGFSQTVQNTLKSDRDNVSVKIKILLNP